MLKDNFVRKINKRFYYGWIILAVAGMGIFASGPGQSFVFGVFIQPLSDDLQLSRTEIAASYAFASLLAAFGLPLIGRCIDSYGVRRMLLLILTGLSISIMAFSAVSNMIYLFVGLLFLRLLGQGALVMTCHNLIAQWFKQKRGWAMSLATLGFALSVAIYPGLAHWLSDLVGWRAAWVWIGILTTLLLPVVFMLVWSKPEELNLQADGLSADDALHHQTEARTADVGFTLQQAFSSRAFWVIGLSIALLSMLLTALFLFQISVFENQGLETRAAVNVFTLTAISMVIAVPILGRLLDRYPTQWIFSGGLVISAVTVALLAVVTDTSWAVVYGIAFGIVNAIFHTHLAFVWPHFFGRKHLGKIQGAGNMLNVFGAALGPIPLGLAYDLLGSYREMLLIMAVLPLLCAVFVFTLKAPKLH